jgi:hypothetical protein
MAAHPLPEQALALDVRPAVLPEWLRRVPRGLLLTALAVLVYGEWDAPQRVPLDLV